MRSSRTPRWHGLTTFRWSAYEGGESMYAPNGLNYTVKEEAMADPRMNELYNTMMNDWYEYAGSNSLYMLML